MVFPGPVLYPQADTQPRVDHRRRTPRPRRIRPAGPGLGRTPLLGRHQTGWLGRPRPPGHGSGHLPGLLSLHLHSAGIFQMRAPKILFLLYFAAWIVPGSAAAADSCVTCHAAVDDAAKGPAALIKNDVHIAHGLSCADCHGGDRTSDDPDVSMNKAKGFKGKPARATIPKFCAACHGNHGAKPPQAESVSAVCGSCHVLFEQLYEKSVHNAVFSGAGGGGGCMVCHSNHAVHYPSTAMLAGPKAVCSGCHDAGTAPAGAATQMAGWLDGLDTALKKSETVLASAEQSGMEVSEAQVH